MGCLDNNALRGALPQASQTHVGSSELSSYCCLPGVPNKQHKGTPQGSPSNSGEVRSSHHAVRSSQAYLTRACFKLIFVCSQTYTTLIRVTYGLNVVSDDDELVSMFGETLRRLVELGTPGASPLDLFPCRKSRKSVC